MRVKTAKMREKSGSKTLKKWRKIEQNCKNRTCETWISKSSFSSRLFKAAFSAVRGLKNRDFSRFFQKTTKKGSKTSLKKGQKTPKNDQNPKIWKTSKSERDVQRHFGVFVVLPLFGAVRKVCIFVQNKCKNVQNPFQKSWFLKLFVIFFHPKTFFSGIGPKSQQDPRLAFRRAKVEVQKRGCFWEVCQKRAKFVFFRKK